MHDYIKQIALGLFRICILGISPHAPLIHGQLITKPLSGVHIIEYQRWPSPIAHVKHFHLTFTLNHEYPVQYGDEKPVLVSSQ